ncbi:hypothetical protein BBP40_006679 [Aspergillus hancockii]|nr:hypothetical protein BBP40_006679 [Aspergillus hancockii]
MTKNIMTGNSWWSASEQFDAQWVEPSDIFSVLLILGGDVVALALAAVAGGGPVNPVAFSFGWVAYAVSAVVSAVGDNRLMYSAPEVTLKVFNLRSGYQRENQSWLLGRFLKTYDFWMADEVRQHLRYGPRRRPSRPDEEQSGESASEVGEARTTAVAAKENAHPHVALCVAVYRWRDDAVPGVPARDLVWWSGFAVSLVQLGVAAIPMGLYHDWSVFLATAAGTLLCYASASLPQWRQEKWHARPGRKDVALTLGNGAKHVVVVQGSSSTGTGLDLEDLVGGWAPDLVSTRIATTALAVLWIVLLITCTGIKVHTWYLLAVGGIGMLHNIIVAGVPRTPAALGLPIELAGKNVQKNGNSLNNRLNEKETQAIFAEPKVMWTLIKLEQQYRGYGKALVPEFFPGKLRKWEDEWWASTDADKRWRLLKQAQEDERKKTLKKHQEKEAQEHQKPV